MCSLKRWSVTPYTLSSSIAWLAYLYHKHKWNSKEAWTVLENGREIKREQIEIRETARNINKRTICDWFDRHITSIHAPQSTWHWWHFISPGSSITSHRYYYKSDRTGNRRHSIDSDNWRCMYRTACLLMTVTKKWTSVSCCFQKCMKNWCNIHHSTFIPTQSFDISLSLIVFTYTE